MSNEKDWIDVFSALLTPVIAIVGTAIAIVQYRLSAKRRKDELFDRRYAFYQKLEKVWLATHTEGGLDVNPLSPNSLQIEDVAPLAQEAGFLFGDDIVKHISSLQGRQHTGSPFFPNDDFTQPFQKYLEL